MSNIKVPINIKGTATVEIPNDLSKKERRAAEDMAEIVATALLMSINSHKLAEQNDGKMQEYAKKHDIPVNKTREIFKTIWVSNVKADTNIGPMDMNYKPS